MAVSPHFVIDGDEYPIPGLETFNMNEAMVLYNCSGLTLEDFAIDESDELQVEELERKTQNPGFFKALMIVAYMRGKEGVPLKRAEALIGGSNVFETLSTIVVAGDDEDPTEPQKSEPPTQLSLASTDSNGDSSGSDSETNSGPPEETPVATGTSE